MTKAKNDTEGKGILLEEKDKAPLNGEGATSPEPTPSPSTSPLDSARGTIWERSGDEPGSD